MVITKDMTVAGIIESWNVTKSVFEQYGISGTPELALKDLFLGDQLNQLISDLNKMIGSSEVTCIEGG